MTSQEEATADAIRYAMLHRLAPGIRHSLMGELQAIQFLAELAARQLQASADPAKVQDGLSHIIAQTRNTVGSCRSIVEWLRPDTGATTALGEGIVQCLKLVRPEATCGLRESLLEEGKGIEGRRPERAPIRSGLAQA